MPIFKRRRRNAVEADPIGAFWSWWSSAGAGGVADAVGRREPAGANAELNERVGLHSVPAAALEDGHRRIL